MMHLRASDSVLDVIDFFRIAHKNILWTPLLLISLRGAIKVQLRCVCTRVVLVLGVLLYFGASGCAVFLRTTYIYLN